jgi:mannose-6-phosphate isomerase-like protein (cupin superfamily)
MPGSGVNEPPRSTGAGIVVTIALASLPAAFVFAQEPAAAVPAAAVPAAAVPAAAAPADATDVTAAELAAVFATVGDSIDKQVEVVDVGHGTNVAIGVLVRGETTSGDGTRVRGLVHHDVAEVYYVVEGAGILVTGGTLQDVRELPLDGAVVTELVGPSSSGTSVGETRRRISKGDIVVIPAGVFHGFSEIESEIRYLSIRVDPQQTLPAGYVNPAIE